MQSYDYAHREGIRTLSWNDFATLCDRLAGQLGKAGVEVIVGIARAGLFPATLVACRLRKELFPVRLTRRLNDEIVNPEPVWKVPLNVQLTGKIVAVVDEIADTGQTLSMAAGQVMSHGSAQVVTACLVSHTWANPAPDFVGLITDELVVFPWDEKVLLDGQWQLHPEIEAAIRAQGPAPTRARGLPDLSPDGSALKV